MKEIKKPAVPGSGVYLGAILEEAQTSIEAFNAATGVRHPLFMTFFSFPEVLDPNDENHGKVRRFIEECRKAGAIPALTLEAFGGLKSYSVQQVCGLADLLGGFGVPMILRWNHEMNGSWYPWGQQPELYVAKFREFSAVFREKAPHIAMAWTPNQGWGYPWAGGKHHNPALASMDPYAAYYPGDEWVDWVGISFYHWGETRGANQVPAAGKWGHANGIGNPVPNVHEVYAVGHNKPMLIAETSALYDTGDSLKGGASEFRIKEAWIRQVYNLTDSSQPRLDRDFPMLKAIFWFNILKFEAEVKGDVDWRLDGNPEVAGCYGKAVSNPYFLRG